MPRPRQTLRALAMACLRVLAAPVDDVAGADGRDGPVRQRQCPDGRIDAGVVGERGEPPPALVEPAADEPRPRHADDDPVRDRRHPCAPRGAAPGRSRGPRRAAARSQISWSRPRMCGSAASTRSTTNAACAASAAAPSSASSSLAGVGVIVSSMVQWSGPIAAGMV